MILIPICIIKWGFEECCKVLLKRLSLQPFFDFFLNFAFKSFVQVELIYVYTINLFTMAENCTEKWIIL